MKWLEEFPSLLGDQTMASNRPSTSVAPVTTSVLVTTSVAPVTTSVLQNGVSGVLILLRRTV